MYREREGDVHRRKRGSCTSVAGALLAGALVAGVARADTPAVAAARAASEAELEERQADAADEAARLQRADREIAEIEELLAGAHFHPALGLAEAARDVLDAAGADPLHDERRARLEVAIATAEVALGRRAQARESMRRALRAAPGLALDERTTSPTVPEALREARRSGALEAAR
jgi:hypothetical protein